VTAPGPATPSLRPVVEPAAGTVGDADRGCSVAGCERTHKARGFCRTHYRRWQRHADPLADRPVGGAGTSYRAVLAQLRASRGAPDAQRCAECGGAGSVWSYDGADPDERTEPGRGRRYSLDPARYRPRCRFCHRRAYLDAAAPLEVPPARRAAPSLDVDRAVRLYTAGATAAGIAGLLHVSPQAVLRALRARDIAIRPARSSRHTHSGIAAPDPTRTNSHVDDPASTRKQHANHYNNSV